MISLRKLVVTFLNDFHAFSTSLPVLKNNPSLILASLILCHVLTEEILDGDGI